MPNSADFVAHVLEMMRPTARAASRAMFGGHGVYADGLFVAIIVDDTLYFKADDANRGEFIARDLEPFVYRTKTGAKQVMSYHRAPEEALESSPAMAPWLRSALGAALRSANVKPARGPRAVRTPAKATATAKGKAPSNPGTAATRTRRPKPR